MRMRPPHESCPDYRLGRCSPPSKELPVNDKEYLIQLRNGLDWDELEALPNGIGKALHYAVEGLMTDGGHHKQWYLEEILKAFGVDLDVLRKVMLEEDEDGDSYDWEEGIAP